MELRDVVLVAYGRSPCCKARKGGYARTKMNAIDYTAQVVRGYWTGSPRSSRRCWTTSSSALRRP